MSSTCGCPNAKSDKCAVQTCRNYDEFYNQLFNCPRKTISGVPDCPTVRSCPNCKEAIEHWEACHDMECRSCKKHFCFICLKPASESGSLTCSSHTVAPVQIL